MSEYILKIDKVTKKYSQKIAVDDISIEINEGSILGILGPNGAGKTSLIKILNQIVRPDIGKIYISGCELRREHKKFIGYMSQERGLYSEMKVEDQIIYFAQLRGLSYNSAKIEADYWLDKMNIRDIAKNKTGIIDKSTQQKIQFIITIIHKPKIIILDEPMKDLDYVNSGLIQDELKRLKKNGATILLSSNKVEQVEQICEHIMVINKGKKLIDANIHQIKTHFKKNSFRVEFYGNASARILQSNFKIVKVGHDSIIFQLSLGQNPTMLLKFLLESGLQVTSFNEILPSLQEIFTESVAI